MTQEKTEDARRRERTCALPIAWRKNRYEMREMQFHNNGIVEARFVVVHGCMTMMLLLLPHRRRVGDTARLFLQSFLCMDHLGACAALRCRTRAARCLFTASETLGVLVIDGRLCYR